MAETENPAHLDNHDPAWIAAARVRLSDVRFALAGLDGAGEAEYDHIGSTSVPGLVAKPILDLQVRIMPLPSEEALGERLNRIGFVRAGGSRPDSPGVDRDIPRGGVTVPGDVWVKRLFVSDEGSSILHVRRWDSPWGQYTVWFRDWLRASEDARDRYALAKQALSAQNAGKSDYDDYTRAKTAYFDEVQDEFVRWASGAERASEGRVDSDQDLA
ncbi:UNVERIFIED_CONTAM: GrpB family protein [Microbacterium sp. SLM126]